MRYLNKDEVRQLYGTLDTGEVYKKSGDMLARPAQPGETVITIVTGQIETIKATNPGDWVIRNIVVGSSAEMYPISGESFSERYSYVEGEMPWNVDGHSWFRVTPCGKIVGGFYSSKVAIDMGWIKPEEAFDLITGNPIDAPTITFEAPWGSDMILKDGDFLGRPYPEVKLDDIYRVARDEFFQTYGEKPFGDRLASMKELEKHYATSCMAD